MTFDALKGDRLARVVAQQPYPLMFVTVSGAHLYGFPSPDSDIDLRGVHLLPLTEIIGLQKGRETIEVSNVQFGLDIDLVTHDIEKFFTLLLKRNGYVLEQVYSPWVVASSPAHEELKAIATNCITKHHSYHYLGFAHNQFQLFKKSEPRRVKSLLYVYRVLLTGIYLMQTGRIESNLLTLNETYQLSYVPELVERKLKGSEAAVLSEADLSFHQQEYQRLSQILKEASDRSYLPEAPTAKPALHDLLVRSRLTTENL